MLRLEHRMLLLTASFHQHTVTWLWWTATICLTTSLTIWEMIMHLQSQISQLELHFWLNLISSKIS